MSGKWESEVIEDASVGPSLVAAIPVAVVYGIQLAVIVGFLYGFVVSI